MTGGSTASTCAATSWPAAAIDAGDEGALVASAEFVAGLEHWAERRNEERELIYASEREEAAARAQDAREAAVAASELADILRSHTGGADSGAKV